MRPRFWRRPGIATSPATTSKTLGGYDAIIWSKEITRVRFDDLDEDRGTLYVRAAKGSKNRHVRLHDGTAEALAEHRDQVAAEYDDPKYMFYMGYQRFHNQPWRPRSWSSHFAQQHWSPGFHALARHTAITRRLENGESLTSVNQRARHSSLEQTDRYNQFASNGDDPLPELE